VKEARSLSRAEQSSPEAIAHELGAVEVIDRVLRVLRRLERNDGVAGRPPLVVVPNLERVLERREGRDQLQDVLARRIVIDVGDENEPVAVLGELGRQGRQGLGIRRGVGVLAVAWLHPLHLAAAPVVVLPLVVTVAMAVLVRGR
jgi:hypothetical protein